MKKTSKVQFDRIQRLKERRLLKRRRKRKVYFDNIEPKYKFNAFLTKHDQTIINNSRFDLNTFLEEDSPTNDSNTNSLISIPKIFSLEKNCNDCFDIVAKTRASLLAYMGKEINIDFKQCKEVDYGALFLLKVVVEEYLEYFTRLQRRLRTTKVEVSVIVGISKVSDDVNNRLIACQILRKLATDGTRFLPISLFNLIKGSKPKKSYKQNKKALAALSIRSYINESLRRHNVELDPLGEAYLDGIISEILNNAEDHSVFDAWYAGGNLMESNIEGVNGTIGEINLAFLNFGFSIFQGFEDTKTKNHEIYSQMADLYEEVLKNNPGTTTRREEFFTLYALQDGFSRLSYEEPSRGTGTMKFIQSFIDLGDFQNEKEGIIPSLIIYSGNTFLKCDHNLKPFDIDGVNYLSLNPENDMTKPPKESHLKKLPKSFPGTLLVVKIYLNRENLIGKIS